MWLSDPTISKQKFSPHWKGPFEILECLGSNVDTPGVTYRIHYLPGQFDKSQIVHYSRLRPYNAPLPDHEHKTPDCDSSLQPQLPRLTALSGALPFKTLKEHWASTSLAATVLTNWPLKFASPRLNLNLCLIPTLHCHPPPGLSV